MKNRGMLKFAVLLLGVIASLVVVIEWSRQANTSQGPTPAPAQPAVLAFPRELHDALGETLIIPARPNRIVSQTLASDEILLAICSPERIVALSSLAEDDNYSNVAEQARKLPGRTTQGAEQILQLQPDLIFVASYSGAEVVQLLKASHAPVFRFANFNSFEDIKSNIRTVGQAIGNDAEAEAVIGIMNESLAAVKARVHGKQAARIMSFNKSGDTAGSNTTFDDMVHAVGAVNVAAENGIMGFAKISAEKLLDWQPDWIVTGANRGEMESARKNLLADPIIAASAAGKAGRVFVMDNRHFLTVSQYVIGGAEDLADALYGK